MNIHSQARTTPKIREEIHACKGHMTLDEAAAHFNVSRSTIIKWQNRESFDDRSHRPLQVRLRSPKGLKTMVQAIYMSI